MTSAVRRILHAFPTFAVGGIQARVVRLIRAFGDQFHHDIVALDGCYDALDLLQRTEWVRRVELPFEKGRNLANFLLIHRTLRREHPDVLFSYNWGAFEWVIGNALSRTRHVHVEEGFGPDESDARIRRRSLARAIGLRIGATELAVVSRTMYRIARNEWRMPEHRILYIPNGVSDSQGVPVFDRGRTSKFAVAGEIVVGTVAGLRPEKRIDRLISAFAPLARRGRARLVIAGSGGERAVLEALVAQLDIADRVQFLGFVAQPADVYEELDLFALTSDTEQMPLSLLEAMASGLPVVSTAVGDVPFMITGALSTLQVVKPDVPALTSAIELLIGNPQLRARLGRENRQRVLGSFGEQGMLDAWYALYQGLPLPQPVRI